MKNKTNIINKVKTKVESISSKEINLLLIFKNIIKSIHKFIVKMLLLDRLNPRVFAFLIMLFRVFFKGGFYINIAIAVLVFLSHALDLEYKLTWELFTYLLPAVILALKSYTTDFWGRMTNFIKYILDKFVTNLKEVKDTVEHDVERITHSLDSTESDPKPKDNWKYIKYTLVGTGLVIILFGGYYYWDDFTKPVLSAPFIGVKNVYN
jgi:hypothetical protein